MSDVAGVILFASVVLYGVFGGADFGAGLWDLTAGGAARGRRTRALVDHAIGPVWEANHVWLIFCLVVLWTAFPHAFADITTTLFVPLGLAAIGIVLRGSGFAFRKVLVRTSERRLSGAAFALSSVITPFFLGTIAGAVASGRVPGGTTAWVNPTSMLGGAMAVAVCAYLAAVFLTAEAEIRNETDLQEAFRRRSIAASAVAGVLALVGIAVLHADAHRLFHRLLGPGLPFVVVSAAAGSASLLLSGRCGPRGLRLLAVTAVGAVLVGWGVAQYPDLLGTHLTLAQAAAPSATLWTVLIVFLAAAVLCVPSLAFLYTLQQRGRLEEFAPSGDRIPSSPDRGAG